MNGRLLLIWMMLAVLLAPVTAAAQDDVTYQPRVVSDDAAAAPEAADSVEAPADASETAAADAAETAASDDKKSDADEEDDKGWGVYATAGFDLGIGAFTKHKYARKVRSRFGFEFGGNYTIPVIDVDIHASTGFSQWMSKAGGSNGKYEFRWADSLIGLSREIWSYDDEKDFKIAFEGDLSFAIPTSKASWTTNLYTTIMPSLAMKIKFAQIRFTYEIAYGHSFHKYTSPTVDPSEVDAISRSAGNEILSADAIAIDGILPEISLANSFKLGYRFFKNFGLTLGLAFADSWSYDTKSNRNDDDLVSQYAKVGRGHSQYSQGSIMLDYSPIKYLTLNFGMVSTQPWKTADNKTLRFPWFDTVSPSKNYTKFLFAITGRY